MQSNDDSVADARPSKSELKRHSDALQTLGEELIQLSPAELEALPLPDALRIAIELAQRITARGGLYRQKQYIGKLMRGFDTTPIKAALALRRTQQRAEAARFKQLEVWRSRLIQEGGTALEALLQTYPSADRMLIDRLIAQAQHEQRHSRPPAAARELLRVLRELMSPTASSS